jgi:hypothetical protein
LRQMLENPGPNAGFGPAAEAQVHNAEIAEALGQIAPGYGKRDRTTAYRNAYGVG